MIGLLKPSSGRVLINGKTFQEIDQENFMNDTAYITQSTQLFMDSILMNLLIGNQKFLTTILKIQQKMSFSEETTIKFVVKRVLTALKLSNSFEFIENQSLGVNSFLGDKGIGLSGGQLQRIVIARTFLRNPSFLLMDEATSAIDKTSEKEILSQLKIFLENKTAFVISHNPIEYREIVNQDVSLLDLTRAKSDYSKDSKK